MYTISNSKEEQRLKALSDYNIIDPDTDFSCILESIATICDVPLCNIVAVFLISIAIIKKEILLLWKPIETQS